MNPFFFNTAFVAVAGFQRRPLFVERNSALLRAVHVREVRVRSAGVQASFLFFRGGTHRVSQRPALAKRRRQVKRRAVYRETVFDLKPSRVSGDSTRGTRILRG